MQVSLDKIFIMLETVVAVCSRNFEILTCGQKKFASILSISSQKQRTHATEPMIFLFECGLSFYQPIIRDQKISDFLGLSEELLFVFSRFTKAPEMIQCCKQATSCFEP